MEIFKLILIVGNETNFSNFLREILRGEGYTVSLAETGPSALELLKSFQVDLILLDIRTSDTDDKTFLEAFWELPLRFPPEVIFFTSSGENFESRLFIDGLANPFEVKVLLSRIKEFI